MEDDDEDDYEDEEEAEDDDENEEDDDAEDEENYKPNNRRKKTALSKKHKKKNSQYWIKTIEEARKYAIDNNIQWEPEYYAAELLPHDKKWMKMYLMTIGNPTVKNVSFPIRKKTLTAYIGSSCNSSVSRVLDHNKIGSSHEEPRTKNGATRWVLCMVLFIPTNLRRLLSTKVMKKFWEAAHGCGKITRGLLLQKMFSLRMYISPDIESIMSIHRAKLDKLNHIKEYNFAPVGVTANAGK